MTFWCLPLPAAPEEPKFDRSADPPTPREWNAMTEQLQSLTARLLAVSLPVEEQQP